MLGLIVLVPPDTLPCFEFADGEDERKEPEASQESKARGKGEHCMYTMFSSWHEHYADSMVSLAR